MERNSFLESLKQAVESGELNSEAAIRINNVDNAANSYITNSGKDIVKKVREKSNNESLSNYTGNTETIIAMEKYKTVDMINSQIATLFEIEDIVKESIIDMLQHIIGLEDKFKENFETNDSLYADLQLKIDELKTKYSILL